MHDVKVKSFFDPNLISRIAPRLCWYHIHYYRESYSEALWHYVCLNLQNVNC